MLADDDHGTVMQLLALARQRGHPSRRQSVALRYGGEHVLAVPRVACGSLATSSSTARLVRRRNCGSCRRPCESGWTRRRAMHASAKAVASLAELVQNEAWEALAKEGISSKVMQRRPDLLPEGNAARPGADRCSLWWIMSVPSCRTASPCRLRPVTNCCIDFIGEFEALKLDRRALRFSDLARHLGRLEETLICRNSAFDWTRRSMACCWTSSRTRRWISGA